MFAKFILVLALCFAFMNVDFVNVASASSSSPAVNQSSKKNNTAARFTQTGGVVALVLLPIALYP